MESTSCTPAGCRVADVICRTIELGLSITGAQIGADDRTIIEARPVQVLGFCPGCGAEGRLRDHVIRELTDIPVAGHPTRLHVRVPRFVCIGPECPRKVFQAQLEAAEAGAKTTRRCRNSCARRSRQRARGS